MCACKYNHTHLLGHTATQFKHALHTSMSEVQGKDQNTAKCTPL